MDIALSSLVAITDKDKQELAQIVWGWALCGRCTAQPTCGQKTCPWNRVNNLDGFWDHDERMTEAYVPDNLSKKKALESHRTVLHVMQSIRNDRTASQKDLLNKIFGGNTTQRDQPPELSDQKRASSINASLLLLMGFGVLHDAANISTGTLRPVPWRDELSVDDFVEGAFHHGNAPAGLERKLAGINAKKLVGQAGLRLELTNDIRRHLDMDHKDGVVCIFHQCAALKEFLMSTESDPASCIIPRAMMLELLDKIRILFPLDSGSRRLLETFVNKNGSDKGLVSDLTTSYRKESDSDIDYAYFGDRLEDLHEELQNPTPHGWFERRLRRKSETYMLKATVVGALIAVILTFLSLLVASFQTWVAWQQWKHPVKET